MKYSIELLSKEKIENEYYLFDFKKPTGFSFIEGQFGKFEFSNKDLGKRNFRVFSIASTCDESFIRISTKIVENPSLFKQALLNMDIGSSITFNAPLGKFTLEVDSKGIFIAGGIGITPIRSILLSEKCRENGFENELIYSELDKCYPFKEEFEKLDKLTVSYAADIVPTQTLIREAATRNKNNSFYYVSGSPGFVKGISGLLNENGVDSSKIKYDIFAGY